MSVMITTWKPYDDYKMTEDTYFLLRPCGTHRDGQRFTPSIVRRTKQGALIDAGGNLVRLNHHRQLEWTEIPS